MKQVIRAKMQVQTITKNLYSEITEFNCVYGGSTNAEDNTFSKATPSGSMKLQIDNPSAQGVIQVGDYVYVDITAIPKPITS